MGPNSRVSEFVSCILGDELLTHLVSLLTRGNNKFTSNVNEIGLYLNLRPLTVSIIY